MFGPARRYDPPTPGSTPHTTVPVGRSPCTSDAHPDLVPQERRGWCQTARGGSLCPTGSRDREPDPARIRVDVPDTVVYETRESEACVDLWVVSKTNISEAGST